MWNSDREEDGDDVVDDDGEDEGDVVTCGPSDERLGLK